MDFTKVFNMKSLASLSQVEYNRLRSNLLARPDKVKLTKKEKEAIITAATTGLFELKKFLRYE